MIQNILSLLKYRLARILEQNPKLNIFFYNKVIHFPFFLPHEKDYHGIKLLVKSSKSSIFLDIGSNNGISSLGFRKLGFINQIYMFEPNKFINKKFLLKFKQKKNYKVFNFGLSNLNCSKSIYYPFIGNYCLHYFGSFDKNYITNSIKLTSPKYAKKIIIKKSKLRLKKFDSLNIKKKIDFIKIDVEGHDYFVLQGMKRAIKKNLPIILVEFNKENFKKIYNFLSYYNAYIFLFSHKKFIKIDLKKNNEYPTQLARSKKNDLLSIRNVFFVPKNKPLYQD